MKRILVLLLALAMALTVFAACGKTPAEDPTQPVDVDEFTTEAPPDETEPPDEITEPGEEITEPGEETTVEGETAPEGETEALGDPTTMNKEQLLAYYNGAINAVRTAKPGYTKTEIQKINSFKSSLAGGALDGLINGVVQKLMPGDPKDSKKNKGEDNVDHFYIYQPTSAVSASDIANISAKKEGANYVVTVTMNKEVNPEKNGASKHSRVFWVATREDVLKDLAGAGLNAEKSNTTLTYHDGKSVITVNDKGQIIKASQGFFVDADAKQAKLAIFTFDVVAYQQTSWTYAGFTY